MPADAVSDPHPLSPPALPDAAALAPPLLLLAPARAAALALPPLRLAGGREDAVALRLPPALLDPAALRSLADPTAERLLPESARPERAAAPALAPAALALAK